MRINKNIMKKILLICTLLVLLTGCTAPRDYKWIKRIRFGCDTPRQIAEVERASALIDKYGYKGEYFLYCILMDFKESFARVNYWKSKSRRFLPHCQPFRDLNNPHQIIPQWQKDMAHWADRKEIYMSCDFKDFSPRKGFLCKEYFKIL
jgi:hypothetical protein